MSILCSALRLLQAMDCFDNVPTLVYAPLKVNKQ
jgi:hypothetical protein